MVLDSVDVGTIEGFEISAHVEYDNDTTPFEFECYDEEAIAAWKSGQWHYVVTTVLAYRQGIELGSASLGGSEFGFYPGVEEFVTPLDGVGTDSFVNGYGPELIAEAIAEARETLSKILQEA